MALPNKGMKLTSVEHTERSQLIPGVGRAIVEEGVRVVVAMLLSAFPILLAGLVIWRHVKWRNSCRSAAVKLYHDLAGLYTGEHDVRVVSEGDFPTLNFDGYRGVRALLLGRGFSYIGSFENLTISSLHPEHRTLIEAFASVDGELGVATYRLLGRQTIDVSTVLEDGRSIVTTNVDPDALAPPSTVSLCRLPIDATPEELLSRHVARVADFRAQEPAVPFVSVTTADQAIALARRHSRLASAFRQSIGSVTESEMLSLLGRRNHDLTARAIWKEFQRLCDEHGVAQQRDGADERHPG